MNTTQNDGSSQMSKTFFRKVFKSRSNKSLQQDNGLLEKFNQSKSIKKLQTKLNQIQSTSKKANQQKVESKIEKIANLQHFNPQQDLGGSKEYDKILSKLKISNGLVRKSSYQQHFPLKISIKPEIVIQEQSKQIQSGRVVEKTVYDGEFKNNKVEKVVKPKPIDLLKESGTMQSFTTYQHNFKDFKVPNQYVKHTDRHVRSYSTFRSKSLYSKDFISRVIKRQNSMKSVDQIQSGKLWLGRSTYNEAFKKPTKSVLCPIVQKIEKFDKAIEDKLRFKTIYKSDFLPKQGTSFSFKRDFTKSQLFISERSTPELY